jgi:hypothetical protein
VMSPIPWFFFWNSFIFDSILFCLLTCFQHCPNYLI